MVSVFLFSFFFQAQKLLTVWVVPDAKLELFLVFIDEIYIQIAQLHEVSEDLLNHSKSNWLTLYLEMLSEIEISEVKSRRQKHLLV